MAGGGAVNYPAPNPGRNVRGKDVNFAESVTWQLDTAGRGR